MTGSTWLVVTMLVAVLSTGSILGLLLRRRSKRGGPDSTMRVARRAIRQTRRDQRRRGRGTIRGEGYGGDDNQAYNAGVASDGGGMM